MKYNVEVEFDKLEYDSHRGNKFAMLEWLVVNYGSSIDEDATWDYHFVYPRSAPTKLLKVFSFKNSQDAVMFALKWK